MVQALQGEGGLVPAVQRHGPDVFTALNGVTRSLTPRPPFPLHGKGE